VKSVPASLRLSDFLDEEFLALMLDNASAEGWVSSSELAESIDPDARDITPRNVGSRLAWLKRYGVVERDPRPGSPTRNYWRLTPVGVEMINARFTKQQATVIEKLRDEQLWALSQQLSSRYEYVGPTAANLIRRRFSASTTRRRLL
jgi:DNA-binding HxlR family transcriptional regulator